MTHFPTLESLIRTKIGGIFAHHPDLIAPTIVLSGNKWQKELEKLKNDFFSIDPDLEPIFPWILGDYDSTSEVSREILADFLSLKIENQIKAKHIHLDIQRTIRQLVLIEDIQEISNGIKRTNELKNEISHRLGDGSVYAIGIVLNCGQENVVDLLSDDTFQAFHKVFLIEWSNGQVEIDERNQLFLASLILYYLYLAPNEYRTDLNIYREWLGNSTGTINSVSAKILTLPIFNLLQYISIKKGGELLYNALLGDTQALGDKSPDVEFYTKSLINSTNLNSIKTVSQTFLNDKYLSLMNPLDGIFTPNVEEVPDFLSYLREITEKFNEENERYKKALSILEQRYLNDVKCRLRDHLNGLIFSAQGGLLKARLFLEHLKAHLNILKSQIHLNEIHEFDPEKMAHNIEASEDSIRKQFVFKKGLLLRAFGFSGSYVGMIAPFLTPKPSLTLLGTLVGAVSITSASAATLYYRWKRKTLNEAEDIRSSIQTALDKNRTLEVNNRIFNFIQKVNDEISYALDRVNDAIDRIEEILAFIDKGLKVTIWNYSSFSTSLLNESDFEEYLERCSIEDVDILKQFLGERPGKFWKRLSPPQHCTNMNEIELNEWEKNLIEMAAIKVLGPCADQLSLSVCDVATEKNIDKSWINNFVNNIEKPFVRIPAYLNIDNNVTIFIPNTESCNTLRTDITSVSKRILGRTQDFYSPPYNLTIFRMCEGINQKDLCKGERP